MRRTLILIALLASFLLPVMAACGGPGYQDEVKAEAVDAFKAMIDNTMASLDDDIARLDKELFENMERQLKLAYVVAPAIVWTEEQEKEIGKKLSGSWRRTLDQPWSEEKFVSDFYQIASVSVQGLDMGGQREAITSEITVKDLTTGSKNNWEAVQADLESKKTVFEQRRAALIEEGRQVISTFDNVIQNYEQWEVTKINDTTFQISGPGLGIPSEGSWVFYRDKGELTPADNPAKSLKKVLSLQ